MINLTVPTMTCGGCERNVRNALATLDAAAKIEVSLPEHQVRIETTQSERAVRAALIQAGYPPAVAASSGLCSD